MDRLAVFAKNPMKKAVEMPRSPAEAFVLFAASVFAFSCGGDGSTTAYVGGTVFDGSGAPPTLDATIVVVNGQIAEVGPPDVVKVPQGG